MISLWFDFAGEKILVVINKNNVLFGNSAFGAKLATIDGLKLDYTGVVKEFPDLELKENWKEEAIKRFKEKVALMETEDEKAQYIIEDLKEYGYIPLFKQKKGFRIQKIKC